MAQLPLPFRRFKLHSQAPPILADAAPFAPSLTFSRQPSFANRYSQLRLSSPLYKLAPRLQRQKYNTSQSPPRMSSPAIEPRYLTLFQNLESLFAKVTFLPSEKWSIPAIATLVAGPDPESTAQLYLYLTSQSRYATSESRKELIRRLREALLKSVIIVGVCKPIEAILAISKVEKEEDKDISPPTRKDWACDEANDERAAGWFNKIYARNGDATLDLFNAHQDFSWLSTKITYGLFLSDRQVLDDYDTQLVVLPAIMSQNLKIETHWHIRGTRRLGVPIEDVKVVMGCVKLVAEFYGVSLDKVPSPEEVESDV
ncbi:uncharacterized protein BJX67DRAFT_359409 [Aspergillus lucknowensis]|uniref:Carboxymuconolactone decarboxylase-like domain-containing protein n=1 Tax=Aspergillus lucknowensis TaxID=176173 RepID=A0ABR4LL24_9EURO